ncbi:tripartite tricarboxylate transporter substrate binding protein [Roseomonas sp. AR75]|uniref:Bug family tripartite tricarboxylate transporter substrate binding protein n=1 Tax=Roseomonas sp. AR75 TaxID=2562311 RepID=UPI0010C144F3|nr:tripartite tricarboxylate transporter substrate binding protein [Roseomonas sp. AR75]
MHLARRSLLLAPALAALPATARAQAAWSPSRPVRFFVGFGAGGPSDTIVRLVSEHLAPAMGGTIVVENKPGASGNLGTQAAVQAPADGHTLGFAGIHLATNPVMLPQLGYDPRADVRVVSTFTSVPIVVMASAKSGITSIAQLVERAKQRALQVSSGGVGTSSHLGPTLLFRTLGGQFEPVQYRSGADAFRALVAGETEAFFDPASSYHAPAAAAGSIRILGVMQDSRTPALPDVPSFAELGLPPSAMMRSWQGVFVRSGTPDAAIRAWHAGVVQALQAPALRQRLQGLGIEPVASPDPDAAQAYYLSEVERWGRLLRPA